MNKINQVFTAKQEVKKSIFIAFLAPFDKFDEFSLNLSKNHPKATHIVWAYRYLNKFNQIVENQNDDKEPKNRAGLPCLNALRGANLINSAVFVVRYFGGIKLGTGGLIRAYLTSANLAIANAVLRPFEIRSECIIFVPFHQISRFKNYFSKQNIEISANFTQTGCEFLIWLSLDEFNKFHKFALMFLQNGAQFLLLPLFAKN